ncbi:FtsX-like permease family protein [Ruania halotolerans]|uniref:FtsX-like permease family protein n=1 Tax=Ruania halotolerans TaxID=2897773 RepID=UPI001E5B16D1|nr:ABC transporter permease [Ruania halotolerans]UFU08180.1 ABC transporter permease [Ruania halotolerans]
MSAAWTLARSAVRGHRSSLAGTFAIVLVAAMLLTATGAWIEAGIGASRDGAEQAGFLTTIASSFAGTAVLIVILVVSTTFAAALRQRAREFALLRTLGATPRQVRRQTSAETLLVFAVAAPLGIIPGVLAARLITPLLVQGGVVPEGITVGIPTGSILAVLVILVPTGLLAARLASRQLLRASPVQALGSSGHESSALSRPRRIAAMSTAAAGILTAATPFVVPGTLGSAAGASSALLLITAAACGGPLIIHRITQWAAWVIRPTGRPALILAVANARGFSRRLTTAIVPLALLLALGTVQAGLNSALLTTAEVQLREGVRADLVVRSEAGLSQAEVDRLAAIPGVSGLTATSTFGAEVRIDQDDELDALAALLWEPTMIRSLDSPGSTDLLDPQVSAGTLTELGEPGTIAVSRDVLIGSGNGIGGTVDLRRSGHEEQPLTIVAVYDRGLGFGDYLIAGSTAAQIGAASPAATALIGLGTGAEPGVRTKIAALGLQAVTPAQFAAESTAVGAGSQRLSATLSLVLLIFVALAALNTLAMLTGARRPEFQLLRRVGATRVQVLAMAGAEAVFVAAAAIAIGTVAAIPALAGAGVGLLGNPASAVDLAAYGGLAVAVAAIAMGSILAVAWRVSHVRTGA